MALRIITKPCNNCPYRKDAPVSHWHREEFQKVLDADKSEFGTVFECHKKNGCVCAGWLTDQDRRRFPSIALRLLLSRTGVGRNILDKLDNNTNLYESIEEMIEANFPDCLNCLPLMNVHGGGR